MKITKKIVAAFFAATVMATGLFAQSNACKEHLEKGKKYEDEKRWVYALGEYYDAIAADTPTAEALEAYEKWDSLTTAIQAGQPGYGEFDEFSFVDNWLDLLKDYEKYWTENCPYVFYFEKPQRTELNRETKTANYEITITLYDNPKFWEMEKTVEAGLKKAYKEEWNIEYLQNWPKVSVYADKKYDGKYLIDGTAVVSKPLSREPGTTFSDNKVDGEEPYFASSSLVKKLGKVNYFNKDIEWPIRQTAFSASISTWRYRGETYAYNKYCDFEILDKKNSLFDIRFHITGKDGKTLLQSKRCNISLNRTIDYIHRISDRNNNFLPDRILRNTGSYRDSGLKYEFKNVPQETMNLIENDSIDIVVDELCLAYGKIPCLAVEGNRNWINPLPELKITNYITDSWIEKKNRKSVLTSDYKNSLEQKIILQLEIKAQGERAKQKKEQKTTIIQLIKESAQNETIPISSYNDWIKYSDSSTKTNVKSSKKLKSLSVQRVSFSAFINNNDYIGFFSDSNLSDNEMLKKLCNIISEYDNLEECYVSQLLFFDESKNGWRVKFDAKDNSKSFIYYVIE